MATKKKLLEAAAGAAGGGGDTTDQNINQVSLLMHNDGTDGDGNSVFIDSSQNNFSFTRYGTATQGSFSPFGTRWSNYFVGDNTFLLLSATQTFGTNWTIEAWVWSDSQFTSQNQILGSDLGPVGTNRQLYIEETTNYLAIYDGTSAKKSTSAVPQDQWAHVAVTCSSGGTLTFYINGVASGTATISYGGGVNQMEIKAIGALVSGTSPYNDYIGYISDLRIVTSVVYTTDFDVPTEPLTAITNTILLTCQSNRFKDNSSQGIEFTSVASSGNTPRVSNLSPYAPEDNYIPSFPDVNSFGFDGGGDGVDVAGNAVLGFGTGDFTLECWVYLESYSNYYEIYDARPSGGTGTHVTIYTDATGGLYLYVNSGDRITGSIPAREWCHVAVSRSSGSTKLFVNGTQSGSTYADTNNYETPTAASIAYSKAFTNFYLNGFVSNFRIVKGTALYTSDFTPPTSALTDVAGTSVLTCQDNFVDNSSNGLTITEVGDPKLVEVDPLSSYWSVGFDGVDDRFDISSNAVLQIGSSDFTLELFFKKSGADNQYDIIALKGFNSNNTREYGFEFNGAGGIYYLYSTDGTGWTLPVVVSSSTIKPNKWYHLAASRSGANFSVWLDGIRQYNVTNHPTSYNTDTSNFMIGGYDDGSTSAYYSDILVSNLRLVKGATVYTPGDAVITVPVAPLENIANTSLLTCQSNHVVDNSSNGLSISKNGNEEVLPSNPFSVDVFEHSGSGVFDGTVDYIVTTGASDKWSWGTGPYTVEGWMYLYDKSACLFDVGGSGSREQFAIDNGTLYWGYPATSGFANFITDSDLNQWIHVAVSRSGDQHYVYKNGSNFVNYTDSSTYGSNITAYVGMRRDGLYDTYGYISGLRVTSANLYNTSTIDIPTRPPEVLPDTSLLLRFDAGSIIDSKGSNNFITVGNAQVSTTSPKFGTGFLYLPDNTDYLLFDQHSKDLNLEADFTVELFFKTQSATLANNRAEFFAIGDAEDSGGVNFYLYDKNVRIYGGSLTIYNQDASSHMNGVGEWNHVAYVRSGSTITCYMNGTGLGTATNSTVFNNSQFPYVIGAFHYQTSTPTTNRPSGQDLSIDEMRITKGLARYTSDFTPPTRAFSNK